MNKTSPEKKAKPEREVYHVVSERILWKGKVYHPGDRLEFDGVGRRTNLERWQHFGIIRLLTPQEIAQIEPAPATGPAKPGVPRGRTGPKPADPEAAGLKAAVAVQMVPLDQIRPDPTQPRKDFAPEAMKELVESIRATGVEQAILVRPRPPGGSQWYEIVYGERRWRAAKEAGLKEIPAKVRDLGDIEAAEKQAIENLERADLLPLEVAAQYRKLLDLPGYGMERLMATTGHAKNTIYGKLQLLKLPEPAKKAVQGGALGQVTAERIARLEGPVQQEAVKEILNRPGEPPMPDRQAKEVIARIEAKEAKRVQAEQWKAEALKRGLKWLDEKESEAVFNYSSQPKAESGYIVLSQTIPNDPGYQSYNQVLGKKPGRAAAKAITPAAATVRYGHLEELYRRDAVHSALESVGFKFSNRRVAANKEDAKRRAKDKRMKAVLDRAAAVIRLKAQAFSPRLSPPEVAEMWRVLARCAVALVSNDDLRWFVKRHGLEPVLNHYGMGGKGQPDFRQTVERYLNGKGLTELAGTASELLLTANAWSSHQSDFHARFRDGAAAFGVDLKRLKAEQGGGIEAEESGGGDDEQDEDEEPSASARTQTPAEAAVA